VLEGLRRPIGSEPPSPLELVWCDCSWVGPLVHVGRHLATRRCLLGHTTVKAGVSEESLRQRDTADLGASSLRSQSPAGGGPGASPGPCNVLQPAADLRLSL